jgi:hypothetical protein
MPINSRSRTIRARHPMAACCAYRWSLNRRTDHGRRAETSADRTPIAGCACGSHGTSRSVVRTGPRLYWSKLRGPILRRGARAEQREAEGRGWIAFMSWRITCAYSGIGAKVLTEPPVRVRSATFMTRLLVLHYLELVLHYLETVDAMFAPRGPRFKGPVDKIAQKCHQL